MLHRAASWGHLDCVKMLVNNGIDLQVVNVHGERAREAAARYGKQDCVDFLDRAGNILFKTAQYQCLSGRKSWFATVDMILFLQIV